MHIDSSLWFNKDKKGFLGKGRIELLKNIQLYGSLSKAAKSMHMSYKAAWDSLNEMKNLSSEELIVSSIGGKDGGGSKLTKKAEQYIKMYELLFEAQQKFLEAIESHTEDFQDLQSFLQRTSLRTSARNQFFGKVKEIKEEKINSLLTIQIDTATTIKSSITNTSLKELAIRLDSDIYVLLKAPLAKITLKKAQDNSLHCQIKTIKEDDMNTEISLHVSDKLTMISVMNTQDFKALHVKPEDKVFVSFRPNDTIIGV